MLTDDLLQVPTKICTFNQGQCHGHCLPQVNPRVTWCPPASPPGSGRSAARTRASTQTWLRKCGLWFKIQTVGFVHFWCEKSGNCREKTFRHAFFHLAIPKSGEKLLECSFAGLPRLIALLFVRLGAADLRKKKQVLLSAPLFMYDTGVPQRACVIQKKKDIKTQKNTSRIIKEFCCKWTK